MNNLPPLPLIDGCLFIDNSSWIEALTTCDRYLQYRSLNQRVSAGEKVSLNFGSAIHLGLEHRYRKYLNIPVDEFYYNDLAEILGPFYAEHPVPMDDWRTLNWAMAMLRKYNSRYEHEEFNLLLDAEGKPMVELSFALPLYTAKVDLYVQERSETGGDFYKRNAEIPVVYSGRIDLPISIGGDVFVMDHKTSSMMGAQFWDEMRMTSQQRGYVWAFQTLTGREVKGYVVNGIRTKEVPQYVQAGKSYTRNGKTSNPDTWWQETFARERFLIKPGELEEWKNNTIDLVEEFFWHYSRGYMPMKTKWCAIYGKCPYYEVCRLAPEDRGVMLASGQFQDNKWSPLKQPSQAKQ